MDNTIILEKTENSVENIKDFFKEYAPLEIYDKWAETFYVESIESKQVTIAYDGFPNIKEFKKECESTLRLAVYSATGEMKKIKIVKKKAGYKRDNEIFTPKKNKNLRATKFFALGMIFILIATSIIIVLCNYVGNRNFRETFYNTSSIKVDSGIRVIQLSDLHTSSYGKDNKELLKRVKALKPDIIICTGDMVDDAKADVDFAVDLASKLSKIAPSYYVYGNNEVESIYEFPLNEKELDKKFGFSKENRDENALLEIKDTFEKRLEKAGIKVLKNEKDTIEIKGMNVDVYGVLTSNPSSFWSYSEKAFLGYLEENPDNLKITAVHEPQIFEEFQPEFWGDLLVSGHTHGGLVRVPVLGPLYTREGGLFPQRSGCFVYGRHEPQGSPLIVSGGLENSSILRINNQPELVVIDINKF